MKVIKNLLFVAKVLYLLAPAPEDGKETSEEADHETAEGQDALEQEEENALAAMEETEDEDKNRAASLLWVMKRLLVMSTREAAFSPKDPLKVCRFSTK